MKNLAIIVVGVILCMAIPGEAPAFSRVPDSVRSVFAGAERINRMEVSVSDKERSEITAVTGDKYIADKFVYYMATTDENVDGYATITKEKGKHGDIVLMVVISPEGELRSIEILENPERKGKKIKRKRFLRQFEGRMVKDGVIMGKKVDTITGATISSRAVIRAANRSLVLLDILGKKSFNKY